MLPPSDLRAWAELAILIFLAAKAILQGVQKQQDIGSAHAVQLEGHEKWLTTLDDRVQSLREINIAKRLSIVESGLSDLEVRLRADLVPKDVCAERMR